MWLQERNNYFLTLFFSIIKYSGMNIVIRIVLLILVSTTISQAQTLKGRISAQSGEPIPYSTVYIQELKQGATSNTKGDYEIKLPAGNYTVMYQSLGFEPVQFRITMSDKPVIKDVILTVQYYTIPEVRDKCFRRRSGI